jgi:hypothetical protein
LAAIFRRRLFAKNRTSKRDRKYKALRKPEVWDGLRAAETSNRQKISELLRIVCVQGGFCGGPGLAGDIIAAMGSIDATGFARAVLEAEGMGDTFAYDTMWRPRFEQMFRDVFGDGDVLLETP